MTNHQHGSDGSDGGGNGKWTVQFDLHLIFWSIILRTQIYHFICHNPLVSKLEPISLYLHKSYEFRMVIVEVDIIKNQEYEHESGCSFLDFRFLIALV